MVTSDVHYFGECNVTDISKPEANWPFNLALGTFTLPVSNNIQYKIFITLFSILCICVAIQATLGHINYLLE